MLLLSYFVAQKEGAAVAVQGIGAASTAVLLSQIYLAGYMPPAAFWAVVGFVITGFGVNLSEFNGRLSASFWSTWQDVITVLGLAVVPQVRLSFDAHTPISDRKRIASQQKLHHSLNRTPSVVHTS